MTKMLRRFPMTFAPLALLAVPFGCGSDGPSTPVAETTPALPAAVEGPATTLPAPMTAVRIDPSSVPSITSSETPGHLDQAAQAVDRDVQRTTGAVKDEVGDLKAGATQSANEAVDGVKDLGEKARQDAGKAADRIKGGVEQAAEVAKGKVRDAKGGVKKAVQDAKDEADRRAKALGNDARKAAEDALDNLLGSPK